MRGLGSDNQNVYRISLGGGENVLAIICGDGCTTLCVCACLLGCFSHVQLFELMDCIWPGSSIHGILQAKYCEYTKNH